MLSYYCNTLYLTYSLSNDKAFVHCHDNKTIIEYAEFERSHQDHQVQLHKYASISTGIHQLVLHLFHTIIVEVEIENA